MKILRVLGYCVYTILLYLGLPLIGWGLDDVSGFFSYPQLAGYAVVIAAFGLLFGITSLRPGGLGDRGKGQEDKFVHRQRIVRILVIFMLFGALIFVPYADRRNIAVMPDSPLLRWIGLALSSLGIGLIYWSSVALGRLYSPEVTLQKDHHLVSDGVYRYIRHPRYLGGMILALGLSLLFRSWIGLFFTLGFVIILLFRIKDEEALLSREFGAEWVEYCQKSWRLIPYIY
jgi:protein-S-isoprenylcysteine O-methyltransferase Ste14